MNKVKKQIISFIKDMPNDFSREEILATLMVDDMIQRGMTPDEIEDLAGCECH